MWWVLRGSFTSCWALPQRRNMSSVARIAIQMCPTCASFCLSSSCFSSSSWTYQGVLTALMGGASARFLGGIKASPATWLHPKSYVLELYICTVFMIGIPHHSAVLFTLIFLCKYTCMWYAYMNMIQYAKHTVYICVSYYHIYYIVSCYSIIFWLQCSNYCTSSLTDPCEHR